MVAYVKKSSRNTRGARAVLTSPLISGKRCIALYYYMYGRGTGELHLYLVVSKRRPLLLLRKTGSQGNTLRKAQVNFNGSMSRVSVKYSLGFHTVLKKTKKSYIFRTIKFSKSDFGGMPNFAGQRWGTRQLPKGTKAVTIIFEKRKASTNHC